MTQLPIGLASDHAGYETKQYVIELLQSKGIPYKDFGCYSTEACDYADPAHELGYALDKGEVEKGIAVCGSGNGINMTLNKHQSVRSALCWSEEIAKLARQHNNANVLVMPGRFIDRPTGEAIVEAYLTTPFEGGRHEARINKIPLSESGSCGCEGK
ncbi:MAG: RpiB/LacA/LacB family sugar-phosphate isomerase [Bacteroidales bacterium]